MADDIKLLSDTDVKTQTSQEKTKQISTVVPNVDTSKFSFYKSDNNSNPPNQWHCVVSNDLIYADVLVSDVSDADLDALLGRLWLKAAE